MTKQQKMRGGLGLVGVGGSVIGILAWAVYAHHQQDLRNAALLDAVLSEDSPKVQRLLAQGADANAGSWLPNEKPLNFVEFCKQMVAISSRRSGRRVTALMHASQGKNLAIVKLLVEAGADVQARDADGYTPLLWAAYTMEGRRAPIILFLAAHGADINVKSNDGMTAWKFADARPETMQALKQAQAKRNSQEKRGIAPDL